MNNFTIINLQALMGTIGLILAFKWWIQPRLTKLSIHNALLPFVFLNIFRYLGLCFMAKEQFYSGFPNEFLNTVGILDFTTAVLAVIASLALKKHMEICHRSCMDFQFGWVSGFDLCISQILFS